MKNSRLLFIITFLSYCLFAGAADVTLKDQGNVTVQSYTDSNVRVEGKTNLFLKAKEPLVNSTIDLIGDDAWLYFDQLKPSVVTGSWLKYVTIDGRAFDRNNDRIAIYGSGTVIIPNGTKTAQEALTVYNRRNFGGSSQSFGINTYHTDLGDFDNAILSFKLKKGFAATLANNPDGTGFSRFFIASDEDIEFAEMPEGMEGFVSFIRVFKWEWTAKKGWAGSPSDQLNVSISYDWDASGDTENPDTEYVPMRHNLGWQSFEVIDERENVSHLLGYNEPDRPDQADMSVYNAITQWPEFFKSGLRLGSPAPSSTPHSWLTSFMAACDSLNYRVDFMVTHAYQYQPTSWWDWYVGAIATGGRPVWITEWNNGANWTTEGGWPDAEGPQRDAKMEIIYDEMGNATNVRRPLSPGNAAYSKAKMEQMLPHFENIDLLEHHFLYNWVQDARSMELGGVLTPAGEYFAEFNSGVGFKKANEYVHTWKIAPPWLVPNVSDDYHEFTLEWYDHNGETGKSYYLQRKVGDGEFELAKTYIAGVDYNYADTLRFTETIYPVTFEEVTYRVYAVSYKDTRSIYSREITFKHDQVANPPVLSGEAVSSTILKLEWSAAANARSYRLERATSANGTYEIIADYFQGEENEDKKIEYIDKDLTDNTNYYYRIYSINTRGISNASQVFQLKTKELVTPDAVVGLRAGSGDRKATLTWDFVYDAVYDILRADSKDGEYTLIAEGIEVTEGDARYKDESWLEYEETYYYKIIPYNAAGVGPESEVVNATPEIAQFLHLGFEEGEGTRVYDDWGGYHADFVNGPTWQIGSDGLPCVVLTIAEEAHLQLPAGVVSELETDFTVASWVYLPEDAKNNTRLFDFGDGTQTFMVFIPKYSAGMARYKITYLDENGTAQMFQPTFAYDFPLGEWAHVVFTVMEYDMGGTFFAAYLNGERVAFDRDVLGLVPSGMGFTPTNYLGRSQWPADPYSAHQYQDFRIYNQALSMNDVKRLYEGLPLVDLVPTPDPTGIKETISPTATLVTVAPNPVASNQPVHVTVSNIDQPGNATLGIYDLMGNCIAQRQLNSPTTTISAPATPGTYIVKVSASTFNTGAKLIVK